MAKTEQAVLRNSLTAERLAENQSPLVLHGDAARWGCNSRDAAHGNVLGAAMHAARFREPGYAGQPPLDLAIS